MLLNVDWVLAGAIVFTGLVVVFFVLAFLWAAVLLLGAVGGRIAKMAEAKAPKAQPQAEVAQAQPKLTPEVVAAITAAIASVTEENFKITNIRMHGTSTTLWEASK